MRPLCGSSLPLRWHSSPTPSRGTTPLHAAGTASSVHPTHLLVDWRGVLHNIQGLVDSAGHHGASPACTRGAAAAAVSATPAAERGVGLKTSNLRGTSDPPSKGASGMPSPLRSCQKRRQWEHNYARRGCS